MKKKVLIDCDVGVDDALALILAFHSPELKVEGITGVNGNVPLDKVFNNIQKVLSLIQPLHRPFIARGADRPLKGTTLHAHSVHGEDGLGGARVECQEREEWWQVFPGRGDELITRMARKYPDEMTLIAIGPLTNLALGLQKDPEGMRKLKAVVIMGGAVRSEGNVTPHAEFNIFTDPLAAKMVFESRLQITLVPLDVTRRVSLTPQMIEERVKPIHNAFSRFVVEATGYDATGRRFRRGSKAVNLHDPLAVGVVVDPDLARKERLSIFVETQEGEQYGRTSQRLKGEASDERMIDICTEVNAEKFFELFLSRMGA